MGFLWFCSEKLNGEWAPALWLICSPQRELTMVIIHSSRASLFPAYPPELMKFTLQTHFNWIKIANDKFSLTASFPRIFIRHKNFSAIKIITIYLFLDLWCVYFWFKCKKIFIHINCFSLEIRSRREDGRSPRNSNH